MNRFESVTKPLTWFMALLLAALTVGCGGGGGRDAILGTAAVAPSVAIAPTVTAVAPVRNATGVPINTKIITAAFSKAMDPATLTNASFTLTCPGYTPVTTPVVTYLAAGNVATLTLPTTNLPVSAICTATITTVAKDTTGLALATNYTWNFTTGATADTTKPRVTVTVPADTSATHSANAAITATFNEAMAPATITTAGTFTVTCAAPCVSPSPVGGGATYVVSSKTATFTPTAALVVGQLYTATIKGTGAGAATDLAGNALAGGLVGAPNPTVAADYVWTFTTAAPDVTAPTVTVVNPLNLATGVCLNKTINATFSEAMDSGTISTTTFTLAPTSNLAAPVTAVVAYDAVTNIASLNPTGNLTASINYTATIKGGASGVKDVAGNALAVDKVWTFDTGTTLCAAAPALGSAAPFGSVGDVTGATNTGISTVITGDMSSTATVTSAVTGFHDSATPVNDIYTETGGNIGLVTGNIYTCTVSTTGPTSGAVNAASCTIATNALADAQTAYNTLRDTLGGTDPSGAGGELGGLTLPPGVYKSATSFMVGSGDLTLDGQGDANAVWIFQMGSTLTIGDTVTARNIILKPGSGAQAKNVFWQVGSSATINGIVGGGTIQGTILAAVKVTVSTVGVAAVTTLNGRATGLTAQTVINNTVINVPAP